MKFARYFAHGEIAYGVVEGDRVRQITTTPFDDYEITDHEHTLDQVKLLAPHEPRKVMAIALNYESHLANWTRPTQPEPFFKNPTSVIGPDDAIVLPPDSGKVDAEGELVVVMGRRAKGVSKEEALDYVLGYTCGNDVSARPWQGNDIQWWRGKGSDTFAPLGPFITTGLDPTKLEVRTRGERRGEAGVEREPVAVRHPHHHQLHQPSGHAGPRRRDLQRHAGHPAAASPGRRRRSRGHRRRRAPQHRDRLGGPPARDRRFLEEVRHAG